MEPIFWLILMAVLLAIEAATTFLTTIWFAGGALAATVASLLGAGLIVQLVVFFAVSVVLLIVTRPFAVRYLNRDVEKTNVNSLIGKTAVVTQRIDNLAQTGQVRINDIEWMARTEEDSRTIPEKAVVRIQAVYGVKLIVEEEKES